MSKTDRSCVIHLAEAQASIPGPAGEHAIEGRLSDIQLERVVVRIKFLLDFLTSAGSVGGARSLRFKSQALEVPSD